MIENNLGWTYLPEHIARPKIEAGKIKRLSFGEASKPWGLRAQIYKKKSTPSGKAVRWLYENFKDTK